MTLADVLNSNRDGSLNSLSYHNECILIINNPLMHAVSLNELEPLKSFLSWVYHDQRLLIILLWSLIAAPLISYEESPAIRWRGATRVHMEQADATAVQWPCHYDYYQVSVKGEGSPWGVALPQVVDPISVAFYEYSHIVWYCSSVASRNAPTHLSRCIS